MPQKTREEFEESKKKMENILINGLLQYVKDGINDFFFKPKDYKDLVSQIIKVSNLKNKKDLLKEERKTALEYDVNSTKSKIIEVFK